jgi:fructose-1,6-bisphosphatase/inositol monophosphatase family enzyme
MAVPRPGGAGAERLSRPLSDAVADRVGDLMRETARELILPRFARLRDDEIGEKAPGEIVTAVDRMVESRLASRLQALLPGSFVIGEEQAAVGPKVMERLCDETIWLVDIPADRLAAAEQVVCCWNVLS